MMVQSSTYYEELSQYLEKQIEQAKSFETISLDILNWREAPASWSALECIEHLNLYADYYVPAIENTFVNNTSNPNTVFKSGWLGNYFAKSMLPKAKLNMMKTFKDKNPLGTSLNLDTLKKFIANQQKLNQLLNQSHQVNLMTTRVPISIAKWLKLSLGDTFRFVIYHQERHLQQANRALNNQKSSL